MTLVRIICNWTPPPKGNLKQTPDGDGWFDGIQFTYEPVEQCDYLFVFNFMPEKIAVTCPRENVWKIITEPPQSTWQDVYWNDRRFERIYAPDNTYQGSRYHCGPTMNQWMVGGGKSYTEMITTPPPTKNNDLVWITSNKSIFTGHKTRMRFLDDITGQLDFDLFGRGFQPVAHKWDVYAPSKYALAIENGSFSHYWTEKIADCFLAYTMPIYYGAKNIGEFFPEGSYIPIDINRPAEAIEIINQAIADDLYTKNFDKLLEARRIYLEKYHFAPYYANEIKNHQNTRKSSMPSRIVFKPTILQRQKRKRYLTKGKSGLKKIYNTVSRPFVTK
ncbi:glycosyltransferase family 10 domain-containing protein [Chloroflexota bacterium]